MPAQNTKRSTASTSQPKRASAPRKSANTQIQSEIDRDLKAWIRQNGKRGAMPSRGELTKTGHGQLATRIHHHGGSGAIAKRLGLQLRSQRGAKSGR